MKEIVITSDKIKLCFTRSNTVGSKIIQSVLEEPVSHVCFMTDNAVIHSNFLGVHIDFKQRFLTKNEIVYEIPLEYSDLAERIRYIVQFYRRYDYGAFIYFSWRAVLRRLFNVPLPQKNLLNARNAYLCTEFATMVLKNQEHGILSPYQLYQKLTEKGGLDGRIFH